jgi:quercetin dioxygenase-like cupin family protein
VFVPCKDSTALLLFIPGNAWHEINNVDEADLMILYVFAIRDFSKVEYHF